MMKPEMKPNEFLRRERLYRGWSQADVAEKIGSDPKTVGRWERGVTFPGLYLRQRLCELFEKDAEALGLIRAEEGVVENAIPETSDEVKTLQTVLTVSLLDSEVTPFPAVQKRPKRIYKYFIVSLVSLVVLAVLAPFVVTHFFSSPQTSINNYRSNDHLLLDDALSSMRSVGVPHIAPEGQCFYKNDAFHILVVQMTHFKVCMTNTDIFYNFTYEVTMKIVQGSCAGILFRSNFPLMYYFVICMNGQYRFVRYSMDNPSIISYATSAEIHRGLNALNTLAVVANEQHFELYINHKSIAQVSDGSYTEGVLGMLAHTCYNKGQCTVSTTEAVFSNLRIWTAR